VPPALGDATDGFSADKDFGMGGLDRSLTCDPEVRVTKSTARALTPTTVCRNVETTCTEERIAVTSRCQHSTVIFYSVILRFCYLHLRISSVMSNLCAEPGFLTVFNTNISRILGDPHGSLALATCDYSIIECLFFLFKDAKS